MGVYLDAIGAGHKCYHKLGCTHRAMMGSCPLHRWSSQCENTGQLYMTLDPVREVLISVNVLNYTWSITTRIGPNTVPYKKEQYMRIMNQQILLFHTRPEDFQGLPHVLDIQIDL